jgi:hypothetical protein
MITSELNYHSSISETQLITEKREQSQRIDFLNKIADVLEAKPTYFILGFSLLYFLVVAILSNEKVLWNDEMYTLYFSRMQLWPDLWRALATGGDQLAPGSIILTKASVRVFGENHIAIRLPETIGFLILSLCLYRFVSKRISSVYGLVAIIFPSITGAFDYSYEARPYALILCFSALSLLIWQLYCGDPKKKLPLAGLGFCLFCAWMSHYYGVVALFPLAIGEAVRSRMLKKIDFSVWIVFLISLAPIILFLPLLQGSMSYAPTFWSKVSWQDIPDFYQSLLSSAAVALVIVLIALPIIFRKHPTENRYNMENLPRHEFAAAFAYVVLPVIAIIGAKLSTGVFSMRYGLPALIGISILITYGYSAILDRRATSMILIVFLAIFVVQVSQKFETWKDDSNALNETKRFLMSHANDDLPIVCSYSHIFLRLQHYGSKELSSRVFYAADPESSVRYIHHDTIDRGLQDLMPWWPLENVRPYGLFINSNPKFYLLHFSSDEDWKWDWILSRVTEDGLSVQLTARDGNQFLFLVSKKNQF